MDRRRSENPHRLVNLQYIVGPIANRSYMRVPKRKANSPGTLRLLEHRTRNSPKRFQRNIRVLNWSRFARPALTWWCDSKRKRKRGGTSRIPLKRLKGA